MRRRASNSARSPAHVPGQHRDAQAGEDPVDRVLVHLADVQVPDPSGTCSRLRRPWPSGVPASSARGGARGRRSCRGSPCRRTSPDGRSPPSNRAGRCGPRPPASPPGRTRSPPRRSRARSGSASARRRRPTDRSGPTRSRATRACSKGASQVSRVGRRPPGFRQECEYGGRRPPRQGPITPPITPRPATPATRRSGRAGATSRVPLLGLEAGLDQEQPVELEGLPHQGELEEAARELVAEARRRREDGRIGVGRLLGRPGQLGGQRVQIGTADDVGRLVRRRLLELAPGPTPCRRAGGGAGRPARGRIDPRRRAGAGRRYARPAPWSRRPPGSSAGPSSSEASARSTSSTSVVRRVAGTPSHFERAAEASSAPRSKIGPEPMSGVVVEGLIHVSIILRARRAGLEVTTGRLAPAAAMLIRASTSRIRRDPAVAEDARPGEPARRAGSSSPATSGPPPACRAAHRRSGRPSTRRWRRPRR